MLPDTESYDLADLSHRADVSQRTVRYYIQQGLLPSPETRGPGAHYGQEHLDRLRLIRRLQKEHLPLAEIRRRLAELGPREIRRLAEEAPARKRGDARDYIRSVLSEDAPKLSARRVDRPSQPLIAESAMAFDAMPHEVSQRRPAHLPSRSQWDRIPLGTDVELHVRRPLDRAQNKQVERLLEAARHIFEEE